MSSGAERDLPDDETWPPAGHDTGPAPNSLSVVVGRDLGTVVVTVDGPLDLLGCQLLESVLADLIEGQGNLTVAVDLGGAMVEPEALIVFITAARRAHRHGGKFILIEGPVTTQVPLSRAASGG